MTDAAVTVVIPTFNPHPGRLRRVLAGLREQTLDRSRWELVIVDNASTQAMDIGPDELAWHPRSMIVREDRPGLTWARLRGFAEGRANFFVFVDDDNILAPDYLRVATALAAEQESTGVWGGRIAPEFASPPPSWLQEFFGLLALRDFGDQQLTATAPERSGEALSHPAFLPVGAGMVVRRAVLEAYAANVESGRAAVLDRTGTSLSSGGDCMINLTALRHGWDVSYAPELRLTHLIPNERLTAAYVAQLAHGSSRSWPDVLASFGICPWRPIAPWTLSLRKLRAWIRYRVWSGPEAYIRWRGACGTFEGLAALGARERAA